MLSCLFVVCLGCGTTREKQATQQLLLSDAVDRSVANIDFSPLTGETVYLDTQYVESVKGFGFVNSNYIVSSIRQQMLSSGLLLQEDPSKADYLAEVRIGTLGTDGHDVNYGVPASSSVNAAAALVAQAPPLPAIPEVSFARKCDDTAAAKIAVFAYHRDSKKPVWQSGLSIARSTSRDRWLFGAGPFQSGSIYDGTRFAGERIRTNLFQRKETNLTSQDDVFRTAAVWDEKIREKINETRSGVELVGGPEVTRYPESAAELDGTEMQPDHGVQPATFHQVEPIK